MANLFNISQLLIVISTLSAIFVFVFADEKKVYIAYMGALPDGEYEPLENHYSILQQVLENSSPSDSIIHSYKRSFNGFAAKLTEKESEKLAREESIVSVFPSKTYDLLTTRSWDFMGLTENVKRVPTIESDVIVGVIDTGVWPESESFSDKGFGPPPKKWKGECKGGQNFTCNNKLIGARAYGFASARDDDGHGTHTASTAAGSKLNNVSFYGVAQGNARGAVPSARVAVYKVCSPFGCATEAILAGFDDAISDGVDVLSVSLGGDSPNDYLDDPVAIGAFHAIQKGILTSQSAGNGGPQPESITSIAPWILTVAASTTDRKLISKVILGDKTTLVGNAVNAYDTTEFLPLVVGTISDKSSSRDNQPSKGKIDFYTTFQDGSEALDSNATGMIVPMGTNDVAYTFPLPASALSFSDIETIQSYMNSTRNPVAKISKTASFNDSNAPVVASFSSRGPSSIRKDILKPDVIAPGVNIIAAWSPEVPPTQVIGDTRSVKYNIITGTSMSCPHASGAAAYVKSFNPDWSPSAIKSALLTTAFPLNVTTSHGAEFDYGAGHIDPVKAVKPGLVYDANVIDYINMLCSIYKPETIKKITGQRTTCPKVPVPAKDLNYPTIISFNTTATFKRTVTNVGLENSTYKATVSAPSTLNITVNPNVLTFKSLNEKKSFIVTVVAAMSVDVMYSASLVWSDDIHSVRSPIVVFI